MKNTSIFYTFFPVGGGIEKVNFFPVNTVLDFITGPS